MAVRYICENCSTEIWDTPSSKRRFCSNKCKSLKQFEGGSESHGRYKGGTISGYGYHVIKIKGERFFVHKQVAEQALGRKLKANEVVHHINFNKLDNRIENLLVMTRSWHNRIHNIFTRQRGARGQFEKRELLTPNTQDGDK